MQLGCGSLRRGRSGKTGYSWAKYKQQQQPSSWDFIVRILLTGLHVLFAQLEVWPAFPVRCGLATAQSGWLAAGENTCASAQTAHPGGQAMKGDLGDWLDNWDRKQGEESFKREVDAAGTQVEFCEDPVSKQSVLFPCQSKGSSI